MTDTGSPSLRVPEPTSGTPAAAPRAHLRALLPAAALLVAAVTLALVAPGPLAWVSAAAVLPVGAAGVTMPRLRRRGAGDPLRAALAGSPDMVAVCDADGRILRASPSAREILGHEPSALAGRRMRDLVHPEDLAIVDAMLAGPAGRVVRTPDHRLRHADGHWVWIETTARVVPAPGGGPVHVHTSSRDVGERRVVEDALVRSERRFRALVADAPVGVAECDRSGGCVSVNRRWAEITAQAPDEALGEGWLRAVHPDDRAAVEADWRRTVSRGAPGRSEYRVRTPDGRERRVASRSVPVPDAGGAASGYLTTIVDVTDRPGRVATRVR